MRRRRRGLRRLYQSSWLIELFLSCATYLVGKQRDDDVIAMVMRDEGRRSSITIPYRTKLFHGHSMVLVCGGDGLIEGWPRGRTPARRNPFGRRPDERQICENDGVNILILAIPSSDSALFALLVPHCLLHSFCMQAAAAAGRQSEADTIYDTDTNRNTMGKGGCISSSSMANSMPAKEGGNGNGSTMSALEKERQQKINAEPKFYWAHDEEPHRRR